MCSMKILDFLSENLVITDLKGRTKKEVINELIDVLAKRKLVKNIDKTAESIMRRESTGSTGIGQGVAIPHAKSEEVSKIVASLGISKTGIDFDSLDGEPVYIVFLMIAPPESISEHLQAIAKISRLLKDKFFRQSLRDAQSTNEVIKIIKEEDEL
ncbi:MAG TPA: PTS fructose transporter subunit IIA [Elusimicrobia bacterium]|nr:PTS fructose transporter subunit IIA [Elusimicrobiota bacterium]